MSKETDPRIQNVFARLDDWRSEGEREAGRYVEALFEYVNFEGMTVDELRRIVLALVSVADDELLDVLNSEANDEHRVYLECTVGHDITAALQKCGVGNAAVAEELAHKAIREALGISRSERKEAQVQP